MTNRISKAVEEFYSSSTIAPLLDIKAEDVQDFCYQHKIKTKVYDDGNESKLFVSSKSLQDHLARSKASDQANIALKWQALKQSIDSKNNKRIDRKPKERQELPTCSEMPKGFVDTKEAARLLECSRDYIIRLCKKGKLVAKKIKGIYRHGYKYAVSISSCEDYISKFTAGIPEGFVNAKEAAQMLGILSKSISRLCWQGKLEAKKTSIIISGKRKCTYFVSIRSCKDWIKYRKIKTKKEDKMNQDNNSKLPSIDLYMLSRVIDLNTLALVYPDLRDWLAENRNATIREFIVDTIKQIDHLQKIANMENKNVITK